jgi:hypothetical protein
MRSGGAKGLPLGHHEMPWACNMRAIWRTSWTSIACSLSVVIALSCGDGPPSAIPPVPPPPPPPPPRTPVGLTWHSGVSGAFVEDTVELLPFYRDSLNDPIGAPRPTVSWTSSNPGIIQILSDSLAVALDTGHAVLRGTTATPPIDTLEVALEVIPRLHGRLVWARSPAENVNVGMAVLDLPGHEVRQLPDLGYPGAASGDPYLSFDGQRLAATAQRLSSSVSDYTVVIVDLVSGAKYSPLDTMRGNQFSAAWLPGDTLLAFLKEAWPGYEIFTTRPDGSNRQQRTTLRQSVPPLFDITPEGNAVMSLRTASAFDLFEVSLTGGTMRRLTFTPTHEESGASVSPDGAKIAYVAVDINDGRGHVWLMDRDGSNPRRLLPHRTKVIQATTNTRTDIAQSHDPCWTPDGQFVILSWFLDPYLNPGDLFYQISGEIYAIRVADGLAIRLTRSPFTDRQPFFR